MKVPDVSERLRQTPASPIRKLVPYAQAAKAEGVHVYHFNIGDPDIKTPDVMLEVLRTWEKNPIGYSLSQGEPVFLEALKIYFHSLGHTFIDIPNIQVTTGGSEAISWALFAVCNPGDEVLVFEPLYANYNSYSVVNGVTLVPVLTSSKNGFHLPPKKSITDKITSKTKAILYCNPSNPTGTVYTKEEVEMLIAIAQEYGLFLLSDEVYREFCYDGKTQVSLLSYMQKLPKQAIVLDSMSKRYSICGARLGALVSLNEEIMSGVLRIGQGRLSAGIVDQQMAAKLTDVPKSYFDAVHKEYEQRRDILYAGLQKIPGVVVPKPEGAFYAIVGLPVDDAEDFCKWLLTDFRDNNETMMFAPASGFYATPGMGKNEVRIAYVLNTTAIKRCLELLFLALKTYKR
jgi:aspartate aminotransferase